MGIHYKTTGAVKEIYVTGELKSKDDINNFFELLKDNNVTGFTITFFDASTLPLEVIERLTDSIVEKKPENIEIVVMQHCLYRYLSRLSIRSRYVRNKSTPWNYSGIPSVIAIAGSAYSLDKILKIIEGMPLCDVTIFIAQHIKPDAQNYLADLLRPRTEFNVVMPSQKTRIERKTIYVAPPSLHMKVKEGYIYLTDDDPVNYARPSIDVLFKSLCDEYGRSFAAILLSGYGRDGTCTLKYLKDRGSSVIVEDPEECEAKELPLNAIITGYFDSVLTLNKIITYLHGIAENEILDENKVSSFLQDIYDTYGYDYREYEVNSALRRVKKAMINEGINSFSSFRNMVLSDRRIFNELFLELSITTTEFFRDPHVFSFLKTKVFPYLDTYPHIKIWCAGCSTGEEPYSVAIMLDELGMLHKSHIYATDLNPYAIEEAKNGLYPLDCLENSRENFTKSGGANELEAYFESTKQHIKINDRYKKNILFFQHSLVNSGVLNEFQLILCRNVMIYFNNNLQEKVLRLFYNSLDISGFLVLGSGECILNNNGGRYFRVYDNNYRIFKRLSV